MNEYLEFLEIIFCLNWIFTGCLLVALDIHEVKFTWIEWIKSSVLISVFGVLLAVLAVFYYLVFERKNKYWN